jgi:type II secretory pathway pseudopilin PulG
MTRKSSTTGPRKQLQRRSRQSGVMLIETMVALTVLLIVITGLLPSFILGFQFTQQEGDTATRTIEYAQDKMEQLMALSFNDGTTNVSTSPASTCVSGCGLGGTMVANATVGAVPPTAAVANFVDYVDVNGNIVAQASADYVRQWMITAGSTTPPTTKTITIVVTSLHNTGVAGAAPSATLVCIRANNL